MNPPPLPPRYGDPVPFYPEHRPSSGKGCLFGCGGCALAMVAGIGLFVGLFTLGLGSIRNSGVYTQAIAKAGASAEVRALLGTPLRQSEMFSSSSSSISIDGSSSTADVTFQVSGPKGDGTIHAKAKKKGGKWIFTTLTITPERTGKLIDLLAPLSVAYSRSNSLPCKPSKPPLLNTMLTSPGLVCAFSRAMIASVEGS